MPANQKTWKMLIMRVLKEETMNKLQGIVDADSDKALCVKWKGPITSGPGDNDYIKELKASTTCCNCGESGQWKRECTKPPKKYFGEVTKKGPANSVARIAETINKSLDHHCECTQCNNETTALVPVFWGWRPWWLKIKQKKLGMQTQEPQNIWQIAKISLRNLCQLYTGCPIAIVNNQNLWVEGTGTVKIKRLVHGKMAGWDFAWS